MALTVSLHPPTSPTVPRTAHLKVLLDEIPPFAQALHDGFVSQDVLLAQVLPPLPGLQHQAVDRVEVCQEVPHALLEGEPRLQLLGDVVL